MSRLAKGAVTILPGLALLFAWQLFSGEDPRRQFLFSSPSEIFFLAQSELCSAAFWKHALVTGAEALAGLIAGTLAGTLVGLLLFFEKRLSYVFTPYLVLLGAIPVFAIAPMIIIWFGSGILSKVVMASMGVFFIALSHAYEGAGRVEREYLVFPRSIAAPRLKVLAAIIVPGALRWVMLGIKTSIGIALLGAFVGEFVSSEMGLGRYILSAGSLYDMPRVLLGVLVLSVMALGASGVVQKLQERYVILR